MLNTCITSTISLRTRGRSSTPFSANDYTQCSNETHPFIYSSQKPRCCCCCCCSSNSIYKVPLTPNYRYTLYGLRQSSLIQYRRLNFRGGLDRCSYARLRVCDVVGNCYCDRICNLRENKNVGSRKGGLRTRMVFDEMSEGYDMGGFNEAEIMLSLLTGDLDDDEFCRAKNETRSLSKKPVVKKIGKSITHDVESELKCEIKSFVNVKKDNIRRKEVIWREKEKEDDNKEHSYASRNRVASVKKEADALLQKPRQKSVEEQERESMLRKENTKVRSMTEEKSNLSRRENMKRDGSSCSTYYSFSSTGDYESENQNELKEGRFDGDSSSGDTRNSSIKIVDQNGMESDLRHVTYREDRGTNSTKKNTGKEFSVGSTDVEFDFRKKTEKKLTDISVEEMDSSEKTSLLKESNLIKVHDNNYGKFSDNYYDDQKLKSKVDETRLKYKEFVGMQDNRNDDVRNSYVSQKIHSGKGEMAAEVSSREKIGERRAAVGVGTRDDKYERSSSNVSEVLKTREIDNRKTLISQQRLETSFKEENCSTDVLTSTNFAAKQQEDRVSDSMESRETSLNLTDENGKSFRKRELDKIIKEDDRLFNVTHSPSLESEQTRKSQTRSRHATSGFGEGSSHFDSTKIRERNDERPPLPHFNSDHGHPTKFISREDAIGSAARMEKSSARYIGDFVNQLRSEISSSEIQTELKSYKIESEPHPENILLPNTSGDPHSEKHDLKHDDQPSRSKGPSDEMWKLDEPSVQKLPKPEKIQENASEPENAVLKRDGKSLWNVFADIIRLRWSPRSENHSSGRKTGGGRSSPNQSTSSETWFSGHDAEENPHSLVEEGFSPDAPSSSVVLESSGGEASEDTSSAAIVDSSITIPALRLRKYSAMRVGLETGKELSSESGVSIKRKTLQRKDQFVKDRFDEWQEAYILEAEQRKIDEGFMREALLEGRRAADNWEVPVGAVLVHDGKIIARGCNLVEELRDSTAHAEIICIREGSSVLRTWRLSETTLYITLEPCAMCAGAILQARIDTVVWGAPNKLLGADGSWIRLFPIGEEENNNGLEQSDKPAAPIHPFHSKIVVRRGVLASECADTMQQFFKLRRKKPETPSTPPSCLPISHRPSKFLAKLHGAFTLMFCL